MTDRKLLLPETEEVLGTDPYRMSGGDAQVANAVIRGARAVCLELAAIRKLLEVRTPGGYRDAPEDHGF